MSYVKRRALKGRAPEALDWNLLGRNQDDTYRRLSMRSCLVDRSSNFTFVFPVTGTDDYMEFNTEVHDDYDMFDSGTDATAFVIPQDFGVNEDEAGIWYRLTANIEFTTNITTEFIVTMGIDNISESFGYNATSNIEAINLDTGWHRIPDGYTTIPGFLFDAAPSSSIVALAGANTWGCCMVLG